MLAAGGCGGASTAPRATETVPAPPTAPPATPTAPPAPTALRYVAIGDSYSSGEGTTAEDAWPRRLAAALTQGGLPVDLVLNAARPGWTAQLAIDTELPQAHALQPDVVTLLIGTNDALTSVAVEDFRARLRTLLGDLVALTGEARRVIVVSLPDFSVAPSVRTGPVAAAAPELWARFDGVVREEARAAGTPVADVSLTSRAMATDPSLVAADGLHPSPRELVLWADVVASVAREAWAGLSP